jgi:hypothetical protein
MLARQRKWQPDQSGNPKGRPSIKGDIEIVACTYTIEVVEALVDL